MLSKFVEKLLQESSTVLIVFVLSIFKLVLEFLVPFRGNYLR